MPLSRPTQPARPPKMAAVGDGAGANRAQGATALRSSLEQLELEIWPRAERVRSMYVHRII